MIKDEFGFIKKNKLIMLSVLVIMIIPFLYCVFFLKSVWDPYGDTQALPVAVVNNDQSVKYQGTTLDVGKQTVKKLKKNHELGWRFVTAKQAAKGLKDNKYYTVVTIPSNFSKNAATLLDEHPKKMQLTYKTNDSLNYLSQVISGIGVDKLDKEIRANVTNAYASAIFDQIKTVGKGFKTAASGATQLNEGTVKLDDGIDTYTVGVSKVHDGIQTMSLKVSPLTSQMKAAAAGATKINNGLNTLGSKVGPLTSGVTQLNSGANQLQSGVAAYTAGSTKLTAGIHTMKTETDQIDPAQVAKLQKGSSDLTKGTSEYVAGVTQLDAGIKQLPASFTKLQGGLQQISDGVDAIKARVAKTKSDATTQGFAVVMDYNKAKAQLKAAGLDDDSAAMQSLNKMYADFNTFATTQSTATGNASDTDKETLYAGLNTLQAGSQQLMAALSAATATNEDITKAGSLTQLLAGSQQLVAKGKELTDGMTGLNDGTQKLTAGMPALLAGIKQLDAGAQQLSANSQALNSGATQLAGGLGTMSSQLPQLTSGVSQLQAGSNELATKLTAGAAQLPQLTDGVSQLLDGTTQLTNNSSQLTDGAGQLKDGSKTLAKALKSGAKQVNGINLTDKTADMMAAPTKVNHTFFSKVANYGHALAPYVLSLALYVGALVFNFAYPIRKVSHEGGTATQWFLSKIVLGGLVATGMALVEATMIMAFGLQVQHVGLFYLFAWLFALASMYLVMFLSMWLDNPGRFVAMVLLMLQLGGAGGTFPMEITNGFYNAIHPFLPMSYSIMGFRQALTSGIASHTITGAIIFLIGVAGASLALLWVVMQWLQRKHLMGVSQLDDNQKLQAVEK
ncbi:YhgE/Pip domain-containing protein [Lacticaseibacillus absianus]|uniref:YhgE/Pip domain-containing protein n=1 Tax=Lacticaseibacillus absianus TaxID=2729623 RepID=UPI0015CBA6E6|nr:YhgE/Pip domain-containing protein [Lacticaseibacillus absianus]